MCIDSVTASTHVHQSLNIPAFSKSLRTCRVQSYYPPYSADIQIHPRKYPLDAASSSPQVGRPLIPSRNRTRVVAAPSPRLASKSFVVVGWSSHSCRPAAVRWPVVVFSFISSRASRLHAARSFHSEPAGSMLATGRRRRQKQ